MDHWPKSINLLKYEELDSTNSEAKKLAFSITDETWIISKVQTNGKGSRGRNWISSPKNLTASLLFYPEGNLVELSHRTYIIALALFDSFVYSGVRHDQLILKWPNDILLNQKKISGILLETITKTETKQFALIIGIGVNLYNCPNENTGSQFMNKEPTTLFSVLENNTPSPQKLLKYIANSFQYWENKYNKEGFNPIRNAWLNLSYPIGTKLEVEIQGKRLGGFFSGITDIGSLEIIVEDKLIEISVGDVFFYD